jgi:hypothetical protein
VIPKKTQSKRRATSEKDGEEKRLRKETRDKQPERKPVDNPAKMGFPLLRTSARVLCA